LAFLIAVNGFFLYNQFGKHEQRGMQQRNPENLIIRKLDFTAEQTAEFRLKSKNHHQIIRSLQNDINILREQLLERISDDSFTQEDSESLINLILEKQNQREVETFSHFKMLNSICTAEQKEKLSKILKNALRKRGRNAFGPRSKNNANPRRDRDHMPPPID
jgi:Spy/CpxP family protein refolding chaperone